MGGKTQKSKRREREGEKGEDLDNNRKDRRREDNREDTASNKRKNIINKK